MVIAQVLLDLQLVVAAKNSPQAIQQIDHGTSLRR
jgi:hypothetical protein